MKKKVLFLTIIVFVTLISSFFVSGTYAKYISSKEKSDDARVAKWGLNVETTVDLFKDSYFDDKTIVKSANGDKVVAPGTSGEYTFTISGAPETNYKLNLQVLEYEDTVGSIKYTLDGVPVPSLSRLVFMLEHLYNSGEVFPANQPADYDIENGKQKSHTIGWYWEFEKGNDKATIDANNESDTKKGNAAIIDKKDKNYDKQAKVRLRIKITAMQTNEEVNTTN